MFERTASQAGHVSANDSVMVCLGIGQMTPLHIFSGQVMKKTDREAAAGLSASRVDPAVTRQLYFFFVTSCQGPFVGAQQAVRVGHRWGAAQLPRAPCFPSLRVSASYDGATVSVEQMSKHLSQGSEHCVSPAGSAYLHVHITETGTETRGETRQTSLVGETVKILASLLITGHRFGLKPHTIKSHN